MEIQSIKIPTNTENIYKPMEKQDSPKENSFSKALEKVASKDKTVAEKVDNTAGKADESKVTDIKTNENSMNVEKEKPLDEISSLDPSLQGIMAMLQDFISGKIDLETLLKGVTKDIKEIVEQKIPVDLNIVPKTNITDGIKQLSVELTKGMENLKQNENISKELPSIIMNELKSYIKTLEGDGKNKTGNLQTQVNLQDRIKSEISNIVTKTLEENVVKVANPTEPTKVANIINETKVINNKGNTKEIQNDENSVSMLNENVNATKIIKSENTKESLMSFQKNPSSDQKNSMTNEEKILQIIMTPDKEKGNKDSSIAKVTNFISQFESMRNEKITPETLVINKENLPMDIVKSVKFMQLNNLKDLTVTIAPKELGEVIIKLTMAGGIMKASITATNKEAYNLLNSNLTDITSKLNNLDMKIQDLTLNIYNGDTTFFKQGSKGEDSKHQSSKNSENGRKEVDEVSLASEAHENNANNVNVLA